MDQQRGLSVPFEKQELKEKIRKQGRGKIGIVAGVERIFGGRDVSDGGPKQIKGRGENWCIRKGRMGRKGVKKKPHSKVWGAKRVPKGVRQRRR